MRSARSLIRRTRTSTRCAARRRSWATILWHRCPQSGEEPRAMMRDKSIELKEQVEQTAADARAQAEQFAADARTRAESIAKDARIKAEELQKRGQVVLEEQKTRIEKAIDAGKKAAQSKRAENEGEAPGEA